MSLFTGNWNPLGSKLQFYRKFELYPMRWNEEVQIDLKEYQAKTCPYSGCIAMKKLRTDTVEEFIYIYTPNGSIISLVKLRDGPLLFFDWTEEEHLVVLSSTGNLCTYDVFGVQLNKFNLHDKLDHCKALDCRIIHGGRNGGKRNGLAVLTTSFRFFACLDLEHNPNILSFGDLPKRNSAPSSWAVLVHEAGGGRLQILANYECNVYVLDSVSKVHTVLKPYFEAQYESIQEMSISHDQRGVAFCTDRGTMWLGHMVGEELKRHCEFETQSKTRPQFFHWCGPDAVGGLWEDVLLLVGKEKDWLNYVFDTSSVYMSPEIDGLRIVGNDVHEFLEQVPPVVVDVFRIGSVGPGALLLEASKEFARRTHKADEYMRMLFGPKQIEKSVRQCIETAGHEYPVSTQKLLLRAASFGKGFVQDMEPEQFVDTCQMLRVLNAVRHESVCMPLTYLQLQHMSVARLIDRLVARNQFHLSIKISKYMRLGRESVIHILMQWALHKVKQVHMEDNETARELIEKLGSAPGMYADVAHKAIENGRNNLAVLLLEQELVATKQVPLLFKLKQYRPALERAVDSQDPDLLSDIIHKLRDILKPKEFLLMIRDYPVALALFQKFCREEELDQLREVYRQEEDHHSEGMYNLSASFQLPPERRLVYLQTALECFKKARREFEQVQTEEQIKLMKYQKKLEEKFRGCFVGQSLQESLRKLLLDREFKLAEELKKEFKIPDKRFWWLKITVLAEEGEWLELEKFSKQKRSPIGYEPFTDVCLKFRNRHEAQKYAQRVNPGNKVSYLVKTGLLEEAAKVAFELRDRQALEYIFGKCGASNRGVAERIANMITLIQK